MKRAIFSLVYLCVSVLGLSQGGLRMEVNMNPVGLEDVLTVTYTYPGTRVSFYPSPNLTTDFYVLSGPNTMESASNINGVRTRSTEWTYMVKPRHTGPIILEPGQVKSNREVFSSNSIELEVTEESQRARSANTPEEYVKKLTYVEIQSSKKTVYVGEPLALNFYLYGLVQPSAPLDFLETPTWDGFIKKDVEINNPNSTLQQVEINGRYWYRWQISSMVLIPQRVGEFQQDPLVTKIPTPVQLRGSFFPQTYDHIHSAPFPKITVLPLPEEGRPENFDGAVGDLKFNVSLSRNEVETNQSITLKVQVEGSGNLNTVKLPKLTLPDQIEVFEPEANSNISISQQGVRGSFSEEYILVPRYRGEYKIPPMEFSFFDPKKEGYVTIRSEEQIIYVSGENEPVALRSDENGIINPTPKVDQQEVDYLTEDIRWIHPVDSTSQSQSVFYKSVWFVSGVGGSLLLSMYLLFAGTLKRWNESRTNPLQKAAKIAKHELHKATEWRELHLAFGRFLKDGYQIPYSEQIRNTLGRNLIEKGIAEDRAKTPYILLEKCERGEYGSSSDSPESVKAEMLNWIQTSLS